MPVIKEIGTNTIPEHYQKDNPIKKVQETGLSLPVNLDDKLVKLTDKIEKLTVKGSSDSINSGSVTNAANGTASANAITYGLQKIIAPQTLPATKKDLDDLRREMNEIKLLLKNVHFKKTKSIF